ncbi:MAG TPA: hypothetical protein VEB65_13695, partial [Solirubrobacterales bacterium]|nr:hypothetical protein [Solirubrobacterales bacterium]
MNRPLFLAPLAVLVLAVTVALASALGAVAADPPDCLTGTGSGATFTYTGHVEHVGVPAGVDRVTIEARGGHGGQYDTTGRGGNAGLVTATVKVNDKQCLSIYVARAGRHDGGWGWAKGGDEGNTPSVEGAGHGGAGGGGASAVTVGTGPLVVAGGGGGGGGNGVAGSYYGGAGGAGANAEGGNSPGGENGFSPRHGEETGLGGQGGWGGDGPKGGDGASVYWLINGGGGGGGAGYKGGDGGYPYFTNTERG